MTTKKIILRPRQPLYPNGSVLVGVGDIKKRYFAFLDKIVDQLVENKIDAPGIASLLQLYEYIKEEDLVITFWANGSRVAPIFHGNAVGLFKEYFNARKESFENLAYLSKDVANAVTQKSS